jgi:hypothetical protein
MIQYLGKFELILTLNQIDSSRVSLTAVRMNQDLDAIQEIYKKNILVFCHANKITYALCVRRLHMYV